jgi:hypothetical protein
MTPMGVQGSKVTGIAEEVYCIDRKGKICDQNGPVRLN